jgi:hypothetical protein
VITLEDGRIVKEESPRVGNMADSETAKVQWVAEESEAAVEMATGQA